MSFSDDMEKLQSIVDRFERGDLSIEEALSSFEDGVKLIRSCKAYLDETKRRVTMLTTGADPEEER